MERADNPSAFAKLSEALKKVPGQPSAAVERRAFGLLSGALDKAEDVNDLAILSGALKQFPGQLPAGSARRVLGFITAVNRTSYYPKAQAG